MKSFSDNILQNKKLFLQIILVTIGVTGIALIYSFLDEAQLDELFILTIIWFLLLTAFLWIGNTAINKLLNRVFPWLSFGTTRFFSQLVLVLIYSLIIINGSYYLFKTLFTADPPTDDQYVVMNVYGSILIIIVSSIYFGISFLRSWRKSELEAERMQKEHVKSQLKALQNHLDPHFLFNNLNILASLIDQDVVQSKKFLEHFADVYRGLLKKDLNDLIPLKSELEFLETYVYLLKIRFDDSLQIEINIDPSLNNRLLPPLTLQMLLENAIKHNKITEKVALKVSITSENDDALKVTNSLNKKQSDRPKGSGLDNIRQRYEYFTDKEVHIEDDGIDYQVTIPLLEDAA